MDILIICCLGAVLLSINAMPAAIAQASAAGAGAPDAHEAVQQTRPPSVSGNPGTGASNQTAVADQLSVADGPLAGERKDLLEKIAISRKLGIGVAPYLAAFNQIEEMVKSGAAADAIGKRVDSVKISLFDQVRRMKEIKERPAQPALHTVPSSGSSNVLALPGSGVVEGSNKQSRLRELKEKYGDQIRGALANPDVREKLSDPETRDKLMQSPMGQKILEKLQGR